MREAALTSGVSAGCRVAVGDAPAAPCRLTVGSTMLSLGDHDIRLTDIEAIEASDHRLLLTRHSGSVVTLTMLGPSLEVIAEAIRRARDSALLSDLALTGVAAADDFPGVQVLAGGESPVTIRLFADSLVVMPHSGHPFGLPYAFLDSVVWDGDAYRVTITDDLGAVVVLGKLAKRSEEFVDELERLREAHAASFVSALTARLPSASSLSRVMSDGRAVTCDAVETVAPGGWPALVEAVCVSDEARACYDHLVSLLPGVQPAVGLKMSSGEEPWLRWFFVPVARRQDGGLLVAQEVTSGSGFATYLFELSGDIGAGLRALNRALVQLNFRREPLYLSEEAMEGEEYARYRVALRELGYLRDARSAFVARVVHSGDWQGAVDTVITGWSARVS